MTDENVELEADEEPDSEWLLGLWVRVANANKGSLGITLWTGGAIVSGTLVGISDYLDGIADDFDRAVTCDDSLGRVFREISERTRNEASEVDDIYAGPPPSFIHLKNAKTYSPGGQPIPTNHGVWWRGRLDAVDGWCFGELSAN